MERSPKWRARQERHKMGYAPAPPSPPMRTWSPVLSEQEKAERERMIAVGELQF